MLVSCVLGGALALCMGLADGVPVYGRGSYFMSGSISLPYANIVEPVSV
jgi:hypothetical protein